MPNPDLTHIVFVLDRSGSMDPLRHAAVDGFNEFLTRQRSLYDAVASTIDRTGRHLAALPESQRPGKVLFAILTDGEENASVRFRSQDVERRIRHQTDLYDWEFLFLGASAAWMDQATTTGIGEEHAMPFAATESGMAVAMCEMSERVERARGR